MHCILMKPLISVDYTKIITRFILHFSKMFLFRLLSLTIKRDITLHKGPLAIFGLLNHEESMGFHSPSDETLLQFVFFAQNIF